MPKKLVNCVKKVMKQGKPEDSAWPICVSSTGLKPHKKKKKEVSESTDFNTVFKQIISELK